MAAQLRWGILGPGAIAHWLARGIVESPGSVLAAVGSRDPERAGAFAAQYGGARVHEGYQGLLDDPEVDVIYVATPHPLHEEWTVRAAKAGKHLLVEKPIGINAVQAQRMIEAARANDVFLMEAFMYRCHPQTERIGQLVQEGAVGEVRLIHSTFSYHTEGNLEGRAFNLALGGGGILDVGCYPASLARLVAGRAEGKPFANPTGVKAFSHFHTTGADDWAVASLQFESGILAQISTGVRLNTMQDPQLRVFGTEGMLIVDDPWQPSRFNREPARIHLRRHKSSEPEEVLVEGPLMLYTYEVQAVEQGIAARQSPAMSWDDTLGNIELLDRWRAEIGLKYPME